MFGRNWTRDLPILPGVNVKWTAIETATPFGLLTMTFHIENGRPTELLPELDRTADAWLQYPADQLIAARSGRIPVPEMMSGAGDVGGNLGAILLVTGLLASPEWVEARRISLPRVRALKLFTQLRASGLMAELIGVG